MSPRPLFLLLTVLLGAGLAVQQEKGNRAHRRGEYADAIERYRQARPKEGGTPRLHYNLGTSLLQLGESEQARGELSEALQAQDPELRLRAFYNLGNAYAAAVTGDARAMEQLRATVDAYRRALLLDPRSQDAKWNLEIALRRLEELENSQAMTGPQEQPQQPQHGEDGGDEQTEPHEGQMPPGAPRPGQAPLEPPPLADSDDGPLPRELAEQILRAVEERERGLQREKLRRRSTQRTSGPDW